MKVLLEFCYFCLLCFEKLAGCSMLNRFTCKEMSSHDACSNVKKLDDLMFYVSFVNDLCIL